MAVGRGAAAAHRLADAWPTPGRRRADAVAQDYLEHLPSPQAIGSALGSRDAVRFIRPFVAA
ncbi:hypothetical protein JCM14124_23980 [Humidesulfovibrio idahonensis]